MDRSTIALDVRQVTHAYGQHRALHELDLRVSEGEVFALLGPNGSGKTTLFRLISTLARVQQGEIEVFGNSTSTAMAVVRSMLGVVFQSPSLDPKLTVSENIDCQAALYGLGGSRLQSRKAEVVRQLGLEDRMEQIVEHLSGGLKRRVELAKGILHRPRLLLMDEPSTGLDPASRLDMWYALKQLQATDGVTIVLTTHLLEEADKADRIAILNQGSTVAVGRPSDLRASLGEQVLSIQADNLPEVEAWLAARSLSAQSADGRLLVTDATAAQLVAPLSAAFGSQVQSLTLGQPSLEDVFIARTGHRFLQAEVPDEANGKRSKKKRKALSRH